VPGAIVTVVDPATGLTRKSSEGTFAVPVLPSVAYNARVEGRIGASATNSYRLSSDFERPRVQDIHIGIERELVNGLCCRRA
jgi:hypothetical protein